MDKEVKKPEDMTWADIRATLAEAAALSKENEKKLDKFENGMEELRKTIAEASAIVAATSAIVAESSKNNEKELKALREAVAKTDEAVFGVNSELKGIGKSNGMMSEEYFFNTLSESMTFGGYHFDSIERNRGRKCIGKDGKPVVTEYDALMINDIAACIVEVKYRARKYHIDKLLDKVGKFKIQFPHCANHKVFLGIGALAFDEGVEEDAQNYGIGIMKQNGDAVEIYDKDLKVY